MRIRTPLFFCLMLLCISEIALALNPPAAPQTADELSTDIATGLVTAVRFQENAYLVDNQRFVDKHYVVQMVVVNVGKGTNLTPGHAVSFGYWRAASRPRGWIGDRGQLRNVKPGLAKVFLRFDETRNEFRLIEPNGFRSLP